MVRGLENEQYWILSLNTEKYHWFYVHFCPFRGHMPESNHASWFCFLSLPIKIKPFGGKRQEKTQRHLEPLWMCQTGWPAHFPSAFSQFLQQGYQKSLELVSYLFRGSTIKVTFLSLNLLPVIFQMLKQIFKLSLPLSMSFIFWINNKKSIWLWWT